MMASESSMADSTSRQKMKKKKLAVAFLGVVVLRRSVMSQSLIG